jgi:tetratricopeptide (TPR) repeat protein
VESVFVAYVAAALVLTNASPADRAEPGPGDRAEAERRLHQGNEALRAGHAEQAIDAYASAYALFPSARLLYNLGQAYEVAGKRHEALDSFRRFIAGMDPNAPQEGEPARWLATAKQRVQALESGLDSEAPPPAARPPALVALTHKPEPAPPPTLDLRAVPEEHPAPRSRALWWAVGAGAVAAAALTTILVISLRRSDCTDYSVCI